MTKVVEREILRLRHAPQPPKPNPLERPAVDARVFLVQEPTVPKFNAKVIDTSPLLYWGNVTVLMERAMTASFRPAQSLALIEARLRDFRYEIDYIAVAGGDSLAVLLVGNVLARSNVPYFYWLRFERARNPDGTRSPTNGSYIPVYVPLMQADENFNN